MSVVHIGVVAEEEAECPEQAPHLGHSEPLHSAVCAALQCQPRMVRILDTNKTKYFRLRLYDEVSKRAYRDLRLI